MKFEYSSNPMFYYNQLYKIVLYYLEKIHNITFCKAITIINKHCSRYKEEKNWMCEKHTERNKKLLILLNKYIIQDLSSIVISYFG
jgi:hypothetical protein